MVTGRSRLGDDAAAEDRLVETVGLAARAGVHLVQVRERDLDARALVRLVARCVDAVRGTAARVLVNDRADVALAAGAHGVHLPGHGMPAARLRRHLPAGYLVGRSVHGADEAARAAAAGGLDYLVFGPVFETVSKPGERPQGIDALREAASAVSLPVLAIGGITPERFAGVARAGAAGVAAIGAFAAAQSCESLQSLVRKAALAFDSTSTVP
jgi:thiamine-phosphate pyrophosphorylase